ncbi:restriction endonuclease subunit S [Cerasicoccus frondis]|uniref:restriction endonuclease subunit S n=1 Tax=Cerasicoccus frondis TaxID=490090 RepID=UPI002852903C|nr:restriction endonuclease subunit S [Cerasicoccus frondis]
MVAQQQELAPTPPEVKHSVGVSLEEVLQAGLRMEASAYSVEGRNAVAELKACGYPLKALYGEGAFCDWAYNAFRFPRVWVGKDRGIELLSSSDIIETTPESGKYLSIKKTKRLEELKVQLWDILISCSGTIGNVGLASKAFTNKTVSQHVIRVRAPKPEIAGFLAAFLRGRYGRLQMGLSTYGSVVQHIEPHHLESLLVPDFGETTVHDIGHKMLQVYRWRDEANRLLAEADDLLHERLKLPRLKEPKAKGPSIAKTKLNKLNFRFEATYHSAQAIAAERNLARCGHSLLPMADRSIAREIRAITKFRKRLYVPSGGIPMLSSKQLFQIDPIDVKRLAKGAHVKDLPEISLEENMLIVTRSGTIGRVHIIPKYMDTWTASEDAIRILANNKEQAGYLYAYLASDYGQHLIKRLSYGSVVVHIDKDMLGNVLVPVANTEDEAEIGSLVLKANTLRDQAWQLERECISGIENKIRPN